MTQEDLLLQHMLQGNSITPLDAFQKFGCFRLGARIYDLKRQGHDIRSETITGPNGKRYARYTLIPKGERQLEFAC